MENIFRDVTDAEVYIDDIGAFSNSWEEHMTLISKILTLLQDNGFTVNPIKCEWAVNSFTPIRVPAGTKNSRPVGFLR
jgi:hypothetical protein